MSEEVTFFDVAFKILNGLAAALASIGLYLWTQLGKKFDGIDNQIQRINTEQERCELNLLQHKLEAEKTYAKQATVEYTLARLHERLDAISDDIKELITSVARQDGQFNKH